MFPFDNITAMFSNLLPKKIDENSEIICPKCLPECSEIIYTLSPSVKTLYLNNFSIGYVIHTILFIGLCY